MGNHSVKAVVKKGDMEQTKEYFDHCPDMLNHQDRYGWTPAHLAVHYHRLDLLRYLLEETTADVNHVDNEGSTLLHHAMYFADSHFEVVDYLLDSGKMRFSHIKDHHGYTALHLAFKLCTLKQIEAIMDNFKGLKDVFNAKNRDDKTPLDLLKDRVKGNRESLQIVESLQKHIETQESPAASLAGSAVSSPHASGHSTPGHGSPHSERGSGSGSKGLTPTADKKPSRQSSRSASRSTSRQSSRSASRKGSDDEGDDSHSHRSPRTHRKKSQSKKSSRAASRKGSDDEDEGDKITSSADGSAKAKGSNGHHKNLKKSTSGASSHHSSKKTSKASSRASSKASSKASSRMGSDDEDSDSPPPPVHRKESLKPKASH